MKNDHLFIGMIIGLIVGLAGGYWLNYDPYIQCPELYPIHDGNEAYLSPQ